MAGLGASAEISLRLRLSELGGFPGDTTVSTGDLTMFFSKSDSKMRCGFDMGRELPESSQ